MSEPLDGLLERLAALEAELKRLKHPGHVLTESLRVVDGAGAVRASLEVTEGDRCQLLLHAPGGGMRARLMVTAEGYPVLGLFDAKGQVRLQLAVDDERPSFVLFDEGAVPRVQASFTSWKSPELMLLDGTGEPRARMGVLPDGNGYVVAENEGTHA